MSKINILDEEFKRDIDIYTTPCLNKLKSFLKKFKVKNNKGINPSWSNISGATVGSFYIPFKPLNIKSSFGITYDYTDDINSFFEIMEECRIKGYVNHIQEKQFSRIDKKDPPTGDIDIIETSCLELDFDILQKNKRRFDNNGFNRLVHAIAKIITDIAEKNSLSGFYVAILRKPELQKKISEDDKFYKESFHMRFFVKMTKHTKFYIRNKILDTVNLDSIFAGHNLIESYDKIVDKGAVSFPSNIYGCAKPPKNGEYSVPHELYKLFHISVFAEGPIVEECFDFELKEGEVITNRDKKGRSLGKVKQEDYYNYNLCHELSLCYEAPNGLIKKKEIKISSELELKINSYGKKMSSGILNENEFIEIRDEVTNLTICDFKAKYLAMMLDLLDDERCKDYDTWKSVICALARESPNYKPLAIAWSQNCPESWVKDGLSHLEGIWQFALDHPDSDGYRTVRTIYAWAREDNQEKYIELQKFNAFNYLRNVAFKSGGVLSDITLVKVLYKMFGDKFKCDKTSSDAEVWFEFVMPGDDRGLEKHSMWKWAKEGKRPDTLHNYICDKLPDFIGTIIEYCKSEIEKYDSTTETQFIEKRKAFEIVKKGLGRSIQKCENNSSSNSILNLCHLKFYARGLVENLDKCPEHIGVKNGLLQLKPSIKLIQCYHEIPITRCCGARYIVYDPNNIYINEVETTIKQLFGGGTALFEEDAYNFVMMYLAACLDHTRKVPLFFIWLGEGRNGKSFLLKMQEKTLNWVSNRGYSATMNPDFLTKSRNRGGGPDAETAFIEFARFMSFSESNEGDELQTDRIKKICMETISNNDKNEKQTMFEAFCLYVFCSNYNPRVRGRDYGTWRRILAYNFKMTFKEHPDPTNPYEAEVNEAPLNEWPNDQNYIDAYFSILTHFYEKLHKEYGGNLNKVPKPTVDCESRKYQCSQDEISEFVRDKLVYDPDCDKEYDFISLAHYFEEWYVWKKGGNPSTKTSQVTESLKSHNELKSYKETRDTIDVLCSFRYLEGDKIAGSENNNKTPVKKEKSYSEKYREAQEISESDEEIIISEPKIYVDLGEIEMEIKPEKNIKLISEINKQNQMDMILMKYDFDEVVEDEFNIDFEDFITDGYGSSSEEDSGLDSDWETFNMNKDKDKDFDLDDFDWEEFD